MRELFYELTAEEKANDEVGALIDSVRAADAAGYVSHWRALTNYPSCVPRALRKIARLPHPPKEFRERMAAWWQDDESIREFGQDRALALALRILLPAYDGATLRVYRGESFQNRCRRTYGLSWSRSEAVANEFATSFHAPFFEGGTVLLEATAPPEAIVWVAPEGDEFREEEVVIDRRFLSGVRVLRRYTQDEIAIRIGEAP